MSQARMITDILSQIRESLHFAFIQRALIAGSFIALSCAFLGVFLVLRRLSLIGDGLAHVSLATIGLGLLLDIYPVYVSIPIVMLSSLWIIKLTEKGNMYGDAAIGLVSSLGVATGVILASIGGGYNVDLFSYLFGNILAISSTEVFLTVIISLVVVMVVLFFYHDLFSITFDEEFARVSGIKTNTLNKVLIVLTSLTVVLGIKVVGTMLVSSLIVFPSVTALQLSHSFKASLMLATLIALLSVILGIFISYIFDLPTGATIVYVNFLIFIYAFIAGRVRK
jgi:zinc transport system permease protein